MAEVVEKDKDKIQNKRIKQRNIKAFSLPVEVGTPPPCNLENTRSLEAGNTTTYNNYKYL